MMKNLISGSLTKTKLVQITDFGESTMELRGKDLEQKLSELRLENAVKGYFCRKHVCLRINFMNIISLGMTITAYEE